MSWFAIVGFAALGIGAFAISWRIDPFNRELQGWEKAVEVFIWIARYLVLLTFLGGTIWIVWLKVTGQI